MNQIVMADSSKTALLKATYELSGDYVFYPARTTGWMLKVLRQKDIKLLIIADNISEKENIKDIVMKIRRNTKYMHIPVIYLMHDALKYNEYMRMKKNDDASLKNKKFKEAFVKTPYTKEEMLSLISTMIGDE